MALRTMMMMNVGSSVTVSISLILPARHKKMMRKLAATTWQHAEREESAVAECLFVFI